MSIKDQLQMMDEVLVKKIFFLSLVQKKKI